MSERPAKPSLERPRRSSAVLDPFGGVAGDMLLGALVDLGADLSAIRAGLSKLAIEPWELGASRVTRAHLSGTKVDVRCSSSVQHRHLADVLGILRGADLPESVLAGATSTFTALAKAEASAHGLDIERVHFHEVGACDAILDICGVHYAMHLLGLSGFWVTALPSGSGTVDCAHGRLPCPVPATLKLLEGFDLRLGEGQGEMVTPTGAALVASLGRPLRGPVGVHRVGEVGYGAGSREHSLCRVWRVESEAQASGVDDVMRDLGLQKQEVFALACELDDSDPQALAYLCQALMSAGALDARLVSTQMKKGRSAQSLSVLVRDEVATLDAVMRCLIQDSKTLGVRFDRQLRYVAKREIQRVDTKYGPVPVKVADFSWYRRAHPEYEDCARLANAHAVSLSAVQTAAMQAWTTAQGEGA